MGPFPFESGAVDLPRRQRSVPSAPWAALVDAGDDDAGYESDPGATAGQRYSTRPCGQQAQWDYRVGDVAMCPFESRRNSEPRARLSSPSPT